jgi:MFS family permease
MLIGAIFLSSIKITHRKKLFSQIALIIGGLVLGAVLFVGHNGTLILLLIFFSSLLFSLAWPLNQAVYSDLENRVGEFRQEMVGFARMNGSFAYIVGPVMIGYLADLVGYKATFALTGIAAALLGIILLVITPKKIHIPKKRLINLAR